MRFIKHHKKTQKVTEYYPVKTSNKKIKNQLYTSHIFIFVLFFFSLLLYFIMVFHNILDKVVRGGDMVTFRPL